MANPDRLTALDTAFLHLEDDSTAHMHVASVMVFAGTPPTPGELVEHVIGRLHLVPRYRQRLVYVPLGQGRPVWTDDPHFNRATTSATPRCPSPETRRRSSGWREDCSPSAWIAQSRCGRSGSWIVWRAGASR